MPRNFLRNFPDVRVRSRGYLPHWELAGATYSVTFRLHDSLPRNVLATLFDQKRASSNWTPELRLELERQIDRALDQHHGAAYMRDPRIAEIVACAIAYFDGERYELKAWCVMPNHVHVVLRPFDGTLSRVVQSWKTYSANRANALLQRAGTFWQREYFDRVIRDDWDLEKTVEYVLANPMKAGLEKWPFTSADWKSAERPTGGRRYGGGLLPR